MTDAPSPRCSSGTNEPFGYLIEKAGVRNGYYFVSTAEFACVEERFQHLYKPISETPLTGDILRRYLRGSEALAAEARATGETEASALDRLVEIADRAHSSPAPQIAGGVREALAIKLLGVNPDTLRWADYGYETQQHYLKMADVAIAALSLQAQAGGVAQAEPETCAVLIEALRNCGCPSDRRGTVGDCQDRGTCGCSLPSTEGDRA